jgi:hypothetical protein
MMSWDAILVAVVAGLAVRGRSLSCLEVRAANELASPNDDTRDNDLVILSELSINRSHHQEKVINASERGE